MKIRLLLSVFMLSTFLVKAQYPVVNIEDIQTVTQTALGNCDDQTFYLGDTVIVRAKVMMDGNLAVPSGVGSTNPHKNLWLQQGSGGPYKGIDLFNLAGNVVTEDPLNLLEGDSIEVIAVIEDYQGETELMPLVGNSITILGQNLPIYPTVAQISDLNDGDRNNLLTTGEQWEGAYIEIHNATVATVDFFSGGSRVSFNIQDQYGNLLNVSDRFIVQKLPSGGGTFVAPNVGDQLDTIRGIIAHSKNNCPGLNGRGYELYPFKASDYVYGASAPRIFNITRTPSAPTSADLVTITAEITDNDGSVVNASVKYATGASGGSFTTVNMTNTGGDTYTANIPAQVDGTLVRWYITATDDSALVSAQPFSDPNTSTFLYRVRNGGLTIYDVQYTPYSNGNSPYLGETVSISGVVTSSLNYSDTGDLGYVYIQQENQLNYAGIWLRQGSTLSTLNRGDIVTVEGEVEEFNGMTCINNISSISITGSGSISPIVLNPDSFSNFSASQEQFEGMLVTFKHPTAMQDLFIVEKNADAITGNNYAEYRIGTDVFNPSSGSRVLVGRVSGTNAFSSLYVSYVNDSLWSTVNGTMAVRPYAVNYSNSFESMTGILFYSFGAMKLLPRNNHDIVGYKGTVYAQFSSSSDTVCAYQSVSFTNESSVIANDFSWDFGDGATSVDENPVHTYTTGGYVNVTLVATNTLDSQNATMTLNNLVFVDTTGSCATGISKVSVNLPLVLIYPNPANDYVQIKLLNEASAIGVRILDLKGQLVISQTIQGPSGIVKLTDLAPGAYVLEVSNGSGQSFGFHSLIKE